MLGDCFTIGAGGAEDRAGGGVGVETAAGGGGAGDEITGGDCDKSI